MNFETDNHAVPSPAARRRRQPFGVLLWLAAGCGAAPWAVGDGGGVAAADDDRILPSREIAQAFNAELRQALTAALGSGGPVAAIEVCSRQAPAIADRMSERRGVEVWRTALRIRNPENAPDPEALAGLHILAERVGAEEGGPVELFEAHDDGGARYMKAIVTQPLCLTCHGESLAPAVREALAERYPEDRATGFRPGELRGALVVDWPAAEDATHKEVPR
jgi:hypothetical protein